MSILGNPITLGGGGSKVPDYTYTGNAEWYDEKKTILKLKTSGVLTLTKDCIADVFCVGGGGSGGTGNDTDGFAGGGGGGGYTSTSRLPFSAGTQYTAVIGNGGASVTGWATFGKDGGNTSISDCVAFGGKGAKSIRLGGDGGSGGAGSGNVAVGNGGTDGADGATTATSLIGNSAGGSGQHSTTRAFGDSSFEPFSGGGGSATFANRRGGGGGGSQGGIGSSNLDGRGGNGVENTGGGGGGGVNGNPSGAGGSGVILIRFA